ncbi:MAG: hypothetical protein JXR72_00675 [Proteobacteria bacterium]|nr:hypothetical protein [Pseudomonadota bacterium]
MKKRSWMVVAVVLTLSMLAAGSAMARWDGASDGRGQRGFNCWAAEGADEVDPEKVIQFRKDTLPLRDELWGKKLELSREYKKDQPDMKVVEQLRKDMVEIQTRMEKIASDHGLTNWGPKGASRGGCGGGYGDCPRGRF